MGLLYAVPGWLALLLIVLICVGLACGGHIWVHRSFPASDLIEHNEVAGFIIAVVGVLYAVLLGFLTVVVWENYAQAEERAGSEVDAAYDIWRFGNLLGPPQAVRIARDVDAYALAVADDEWPKMRTGGTSARAQALVVALIGDVAHIPVDGLVRSNIQNHLYDRVQILADLRRRRINDTETAVHPVIKLGLILGALTVIGFLYIFGMEHFRAQLLMTALTAAMIGILMGLILLLDFPFRGDVSVSPERWHTLHATIAGAVR